MNSTRTKSSKAVKEIGDGPHSINFPAVQQFSLTRRSGKNFCQPRTTERRKMSHDLLSLLLPRRCPQSTKSEDYLSVWGCRWQEDIQNGFSLKKNHFTTKISKRFVSYRHHLTEEIAVEVTEVVGVSPALWYFRYIASIFLALHKRLWSTLLHVNKTTKKCIQFLNK